MDAGLPAMPKSFKNRIPHYWTPRTSQPCHIRQLFTIQLPRYMFTGSSSSYLSLSAPPVSSSLVLQQLLSLCCNQLFGTESQKTSVVLLILLTHLLISPILHLHSPPVYIPLTTEDRSFQAILSGFYSYMSPLTEASIPPKAMM